jgi:putative ABC transport system permease protein
MTGPLHQQQDAFARELRSAPGIAAVSRASGSPLRPKINSYEAGGRTVELHNLLVDPHYVKTTGLSVAAGRDFDPDRPGDVFQTVLVNRRAAALLGWEDPVGKTFRRTGRGWPGDAQFEVIGVVEGVHTQSLRAPIRPVVLQVAPPYFSRFVVRAEAGRLPEALASMRSTWQQFVPDRAFSPTLLGSEVAALYEQERRLARGTMAFGGAALVVACLGLYGVAAIVAHRRRREAGLRKALGASTGQVTGRLTGRLLRLVGFGLVLALPLGWLGVNRWYRQFAYAAEVPVGAMLVVGGGTAAVAALVIAVHTLRAAQADPAAVLREE